MEPYQVCVHMIKRSTIFGLSFAPPDKNEVGSWHTLRTTCAQDGLKVKAVEDGELKGHDNRSGCRHWTGCTIFRRAGEQMFMRFSTTSIRRRHHMTRPRQSALDNNDDHSVEETIENQKRWVIDTVNARVLLPSGSNVVGNSGCETVVSGKSNVDAQSSTVCDARSGDTSEPTQRRIRQDSSIASLVDDVNDKTTRKGHQSIRFFVDHGRIGGVFVLTHTAAGRI